MKIVIAIICLILYTSAQQCVSNEQFYDIFSSENETQEWDLNTQFFTGEYLKFKVTQESNLFQVLNPLHQIGESTNAQTLKILSLKPQKQQENGAWTNQFVALGFNQTYFQVLYSKDGILNQYRNTNFNESIQIREKTSDFSCFDFDFISETKFVVDCSLIDQDNSQNYLNGLFILDTEDKKYFGIELIDNPFGYNYTEYRIVQFHKYIFENQNYQNLYFRSEPAWATEKAKQTLILEGDSKIEVFEFTNKFTLQQRTPITILTNSILAQLLLIDESVLNFSLVDFKIDANGQIYILDSSKGLYILSLNLPSLEWKLNEWFINPFKTACLGFDINHSIQKDGTITKKLILVFNDKLILYENGVILFGIKIPDIEQYNSFQIQLSQKYIVLRIKTMIYIYNINNGNKIFTSLENLDRIIVNPNYEDIVGINSQISKRFFINNGLLRLNKADTSSSKTNIVTLIAETIEQPVKKCQVTINLYVLKRNEQQIYTSNNNPIKPVVTIPSFQIYLDQIASGPNLQYSQINQLEKDYKQSYISYKIQQLLNLKIDNIHMPDPKNIVYSDIVANENQKEFYLLYQIPSKIVYVYSCQHQYQNMEQTLCYNYDTFSFPSIIDKSEGFFYWFTLNSELIFIHQNSQFSLDIYSSKQGRLTKVFQLLFNNSVIENQISSVAIISNYIYVVQSGLKRISIFNLDYPFSLLSVINQDYIQKFGISGTFTPIKVFGNKNNNLAFIQTQNSVLIGSLFEIYSPYFTIYKEIQINIGSQVEIAIGINSFFILQVLKDQQQIEEYNYQNLQSIFKLKDVPLYNYKIQKPLTIDYSFQTGWLYVRATDGQQTVILVYQPNVLSHATLNKIIDTKILIKDGQAFNFAVDGIDQMILYYNNITNHQFVSIYAKPLLYFTPKSDQIEYVYNQLLAIQISGITGVKPITSQSYITILNTQSNLFIQQTLFDSKQKIFQFIKQSGTQLISMGTDWYSGQVVNFDIKCQNCVSQTQISSNVYKIIDGNYCGSPILDGQSFGQAGQVYQTRNALIFDDLQNRMKRKILMNLNQENCYQISISADYNYILSAWQNNNNQFGLFIHQCKYQDICSQFRQGIYTLKSFQKIAKTYMPDSRNIIILNSNFENFSAFLNFIVVASLDDDGTEFQITHQYVINNQYVGTNQLFIADFDFIKYQINGAQFATILLTDINNGIYFAHFKYNDQGLLIKTTNELFKLINFQDDQFFIDQETKFYQVKVISFQLNQNLLQLNVLVTTNNQAQYVIALDLNAQNPQFGLPIIKSKTSLIYVLTPYGNWPSINKLSVFKDFVAIPYTNQSKVVIGIYSIPNFRESSAKILSFTHSLSSSDYNNISSEDFVMIFNKDNDINDPSIFININLYQKYGEFLIEKFQIRKDPQILLSNSTSFENQLQIEICLKNDFNQICGNATLLSINPTKVSSEILEAKFLE